MKKMFDSPEGVLGTAVAAMLLAAVLSLWFTRHPAIILVMALAGGGIAFVLAYNEANRRYRQRRGIK